MVRGLAWAAAHLALILNQCNQKSKCRGAWAATQLGRLTTARRFYHGLSTCMETIDVCLRTGGMLGQHGFRRLHGAKAPPLLAWPQIRTLCDLPRGMGLPLVPFYARTVAILGQVFPDVPQGELCYG